MRRALTLLVFLLAAAPAQAQDLHRVDRASAKAALAHVERLLDGRGARDKRALTTAIVELVRTRSALGATDKKRAARLLARPPDNDGSPGRWTAPAADQRVSCTPQICVHWVTTTDDAPPAGNAYIDFVANTFQQVYAVEVGTLGWTPPLPDNPPSTGGPTGALDVYISDIGDEAYGYAVPEGTLRSTTSYLVLDNDYNDEQFPEYDDDYTVPVQATAAHEFNHVLQFVYDSLQDLWMMESSATWAEDKVFDAANDYLVYLGPWAMRPQEPITSDASLKLYGSAIWNHWLDGRYGQNVVRRAWEISQANSVSGIGYAPAAYDRAIREAGGPGFSTELSIFSAATAEWDAANSGIREGATFPSEVRRNGTLAMDGPTVTGQLDHTAFALYSVTVPGGTANLYLTGGLPAGTTGSIALVGFAGGSQTRVVSPLDADGRVTATLPDPGRFARITAVVTNADTSNTGFSGGDWLWSKEAQPFSLSATSVAPVEPTPTPTPTTTVTPTPTPTPPPKPTLTLSRSTTKIRSAARTGVLALFAKVNKKGAITARSSVTRATALRLKVGRRTTSTGTGRRTATKATRYKVNIRLTRKARAALKRHTRRKVKIAVSVTFVPADGTAAVKKPISIVLKP